MYPVGFSLNGSCSELAGCAIPPLRNPPQPPHATATQTDIALQKRHSPIPSRSTPLLTRAAAHNYFRSEPFFRVPTAASSDCGTPLGTFPARQSGVPSEARVTVPGAPVHAGSAQGEMPAAIELRPKGSARFK